MPKDLIRELSEMAFASRLKRLSERLMKDVSLLYHKLGIDFESRWFGIYYALHRRSPRTVTGLSAVLGVTHTAVSNLAREMEKEGLLSSSPGRKDARERLIRITPKGRLVAKELSPIWREVKSATEELIISSGSDLFRAFDTIERQLDRQDMYERVWLRLKGSLPADVEIREYTPSMKKHFKALNTEWLREYFSVEEKDRKMLSDPARTIVRSGGAILFAVLDGEVAGTCALIRHRNGATELAKMVVSKRYRGRGIGRQLVEAAVGKAKALDARELYLQTSARLKEANRLYRKFGFTKTKTSVIDESAYKRPTYVMKLVLE